MGLNVSRNQNISTSKVPNQGFDRRQFLGYGLVSLGWIGLVSTLGWEGYECNKMLDELDELTEKTTKPLPPLKQQPPKLRDKQILVEGLGKTIGIITGIGGSIYTIGAGEDILSNKK